MVFISTKPKSRQYTAADGVRSKRYKAVRGDLPDPDVLKVDEAYQDFMADLAPLITTLSINSDVPLVDSAFGSVQERSPISYQHPVPVSRVIIHHPDAPPPPPLPLDGHRLDPTTCSFVCTHQQHLNLMSLNITFDMARSIEVATREQSGSAEWHSLRKMRLTSSRFREVCHVRGNSSAENLAERIRKGGVQTALMKRGLALEPVAVQEYAHIKNVSYWPSGFVIHPDAPWLGSSPDGVVFDPMEAPPFGLVEVKCPNVKSYVDCGYLQMQSGALRLKPGHSYYWQVQGQLLITGMQWCDFVVFAEEDVLVQRIYKDAEVARVIRERGDYFFFYHYLI
uniref:YqaJ viral recombinase domain-containing protein n=1 Tax=Sparus aurata TaxID=8175 RepID=A0A671VQF8_SPAAU